MSFLKCASVMAVCVLALSLTACDLPLPEQSSAAESESEHSRYDIAGLKDRAAALRDCWNEPDQEAHIESEIKAILSAVDEAYALSMRAEIASDADWSDDSLNDLQIKAYQDFNAATDIAGWVFTNGYQSSQYPDLFEPYADMENLGYYISNGLTRVIANARSDASASKDLLNEYYDTAFEAKNDADDPDETNRTCAGFYLRSIEDYESSDFMYQYHNRDYTPADVERVYQEIVEKIVPLQSDLDAALAMTEPDDYTLRDDAYSLLKKYAPRISEKVAESSEKLFREQLYTVPESDKAYDGSYTVAFPNEQSAQIYTYLDGTFYDLLTVTHEFGHFHSDWRDTTPVYCQVTNMDIAEAQSQCMEMLFTSFYGDIFGDDAEYYELLALYSLLDSIAAGFSVGQFENEAVDNQDTLTEDELVKLFDSYAEACNIGHEMYEVSHLYEQPGYYVSYGVSALPALQLYTLMQEDHSKAVAIYDKLSSISYAAGDYSFNAAMSECGFESCFAPDMIDRSAELVRARIDELIS